jgi:phosphoglycerate dehydrogenase-like enzyme
MRVASQLGPQFEAALQAVRPDLAIVNIEAGAPAELEPDIRALVTLPFRRSGQAEPPRPQLWPFGLEWVQMISVGADLYPGWLFDGPVVTCSRGANSVALAEFALAAIFAHAKDLPGIWIQDASQWAMHLIGMVRGATLGIVGLGAIGEALAPRALALGMKVLATRRTDTPLGVAGVERAESLEDLFARSDHVVLAAPATAETQGMISAAVLKTAKPGLHLINIARGVLVDDAALLAALDRGQVSLASLDVTHPEPLPTGHPFYTHPKVRLSPHLAAITRDNLPSFLAKFLQNLDRFERGDPLIDVVDPSRGY